MINLLYWLLYFFILLSFGSFCLFACSKREESFHLESFIGISGLLGGGIIFLIGLYSYLIGLEISVNILLGLLIMSFLGVMILYKSKNIKINYSLKNIHLLEIIFIVVIVLQFGFIFSQSFYRPVAMNDDWSHWAGKAKFLYYHGKINKVFFDETNLSNYPLFLTIHEVLYSKLCGKWDDFACKSVIIHFLLSFLLFFYSQIRNNTSRLYALFWTFFILCIPMYVRSGLDGTAENTYSFYLGAMIFSFYNYLIGKQAKNLILASIFASVLSSIKLEGVYPALICAFLFVSFLVFIDNKRIKFFLTAFIFSLLIVNVPWVYMKFIGNCTASRMGYFSLDWLTKIKTYKEILIMIREFLTPSRYTGISTFYFGLSLVLYFLFNKKTVQSIFVLLFIICTAAVYAFGCYSIGWGEQFIRLLSHFIAVMVFFSSKELYFFIYPLLNYKYLTLKND